MKSKIKKGIIIFLALLLAFGGFIFFNLFLGKKALRQGNTLLLKAQFKEAADRASLGEKYLQRASLGPFLDLKGGIYLGEFLEDLAQSLESIEEGDFEEARRFSKGGQISSSLAQAFLLEKSDFLGREGAILKERKEDLALLQEIMENAPCLLLLESERPRRSTLSSRPKGSRRLGETSDSCLYLLRNPQKLNRQGGRVEAWGRFDSQGNIEVFPGPPHDTSAKIISLDTYFLGQPSPSSFTKLLSLGLNSLLSQKRDLSFLEKIRRGLEEGHLSFPSSQPQEKDYISLEEINLSPEASSLDLKTSLNLEISPLTQGNMAGRLSWNYSYLSERSYKGSVFLTLPQGAKLIKGQQETTLRLSPEARGSLTFRFTLPSALVQRTQGSGEQSEPGSYQFLVKKQRGKERLGLAFVFLPPKDVEIKNLPPGAKRVGRVVRWEGESSKDIKLRFDKEGKKS